MNEGPEPRTSQAGFTIVELSLAIVILLIAMGAVAMALASLAALVLAFAMPKDFTTIPVSYTHLTLPTNREG